MDKGHRTSTPRVIVALVAAFAISIADAQTTTQPAAKPASQAAAQSSSAQKTPKVFKEDELASLLAPIALYPDTVIAQVLMASTYPLEVVQTARWYEKNKSLQGQALADAAKKQP